MIEIVVPTWVVGSERRFFNFVKSLDQKDRIGIISHTDADGIIAAKVASIVLDRKSVV